MNQMQVEATCACGKTIQVTAQTEDQKHAKSAARIALSYSNAKKDEAQFWAGAINSTIHVIISGLSVINQQGRCSYYKGQHHFTVR